MQRRAAMEELQRQVVQLQAEMGILQATVQRHHQVHEDNIKKVVAEAGVVVQGIVDQADKKFKQQESVIQDLHTSAAVEFNNIQNLITKDKFDVEAVKSNMEIYLQEIKKKIEELELQDGGRPKGGTGGHDKMSGYLPSTHYYLKPVIINLSHGKCGRKT